MSELTDQQKVFVAEYLVDFNATQAAIRAGYAEKSAHSQGSRLLDNPAISQAVKKSVTQRSESLGLNADNLLLRALLVFDRSMQAEPVLKWNPDTGQNEPVGVYKYDGLAAVKALELIGKLLGAFMKPDNEGEKVVFNININTTPKSQQEPSAIVLPTDNPPPVILPRA